MCQTLHIGHAKRGEQHVLGSYFNFMAGGLRKSVCPLTRFREFRYGSGSAKHVERLQENPEDKRQIVQNPQFLVFSIFSLR